MQLSGKVTTRPLQAESPGADVLKLPLEKYAALVSLTRQAESATTGSLGFHDPAASLLQLAEIKEVRARKLLRVLSIAAIQLLSWHWRHTHE